MSGHVHKDYTGAKFGMWLFLFTEVLLFGGLFILYAVYLARYPKEFISAGSQLNVWFGGGNTLVLLTSSLFVAVSITALRKGQKKFCLGLLGATIACAAIFMVNKFFLRLKLIQQLLFWKDLSIKQYENHKTNGYSNSFDYYVENLDKE